MKKISFVTCILLKLLTFVFRFQCNSEKLGMILDPTKADECNKSYNKLLKTALRLKNSNIHEALQKICSTYYLMLDYPKFLNTSKLDIPESIENLSSSNRQLFFIRDEKLSDGYLA